MLKYDEKKTCLHCRYSLGVQIPGKGQKLECHIDPPTPFAFPIPRQSGPAIVQGANEAQMMRVDIETVGVWPPVAPFATCSKWKLQEEEDEDAPSQKPLLA